MVDAGAEGSGVPVQVGEVEKDKSVARKLREALSDAYTFVRSAEANKALYTVTLEELMGDQIKRNGETKKSNSSQFNPYSYEVEKTGAAGSEPEKIANFLGASDTSRPTKLDAITAIHDELSKVIDDVKKTPPVEVAAIEEYNDALLTSCPKAGS